MTGFDSQTLCMIEDKNFLYVENAERMVNFSDPRFYAIGASGLEFYNSSLKKVSPLSLHMYLTALGYTKKEIKDLKFDKKIFYWYN